MRATQEVDVTTRNNRGVGMAEYTLYKRRAKKGYIWWYYWFDIGGNRQYKSTRCRNRDDAEQYIKKLERDGNPEDVTLKQYAADFFIPGKCDWLQRQKAKGKAISDPWAEVRRAHLENHLFPKYGNLPLQQFNPVAVEKWLLSMELSNSTRNQIIYSLHIVIAEAHREGILQHDPLANVEPFSTQTYKERDILTDDDIEKLFPDDDNEFKKIWYEFQDGTMFATMLSAGLRSGEVRALQWMDIDFGLSGIYIRRALNIKQILGDPKGKEIRAIPIPGRTLSLLSDWRDSTHYDSLNDFVFPDADGNPITRYVALGHFRKGLERSMIEVNGREILVHSLRHTYNTRMRARLADGVLRELTGHKSEAMTDRYDHAELVDRLKKLQPQRKRIDSFWDDET
jgi:integrase